MDWESFITHQLRTIDFVIENEDINRLRIIEDAIFILSEKKIPHHVQDGITSIIREYIKNEESSPIPPLSLKRWLCDDCGKWSDKLRGTQGANYGNCMECGQKNCPVFAKEDILTADD